MFFNQSKEECKIYWMNEYIDKFPKALEVAVFESCGEPLMPLDRPLLMSLKERTITAQTFMSETSMSETEPLITPSATKFDDTIANNKRTKERLAAERRKYNERLRAELMLGKKPPIK